MAEMAGAARAASVPVAGAPPRLGVRPALDGLRGLAVAAVLVGHLGEFVVPEADGWLLPGGFLGVDVFFVLSGFLITTLLASELDRTGGLRVLAFWGRRLMRLWPALAVFLAAHAIYTAVIGGSLGDEARIAALGMAFVANWQLSWGFVPPFSPEVATAPGVILLDMNHLWTLAVEGQFYLVAPLVVWGLRRLAGDVRVRLGILGIAIVGVMVLRVIELDAWGDWILVYNRTDARIDALLVGMMAAIAWRNDLVGSPTLRRRLGVVGAVVVLGAMVVGRIGATWLFDGGFTLVAVATATIILGALVRGSGTEALLALAPVAALGRASYSVYLWHLPVFIWTVRVLPDAPVARVPLALGVTAVTAGASYLLVERPVMRRRGRLRSSS